MTSLALLVQQILCEYIQRESIHSHGQSDPQALYMVQGKGERCKIFTKLITFKPF